MRGPFNEPLRLGLAALSAAGAELDVACVGQFMLSRPLIVGALLGGAVGHARLGAGLGVLGELFSLAELPVGSHVPLNATVATAASVLMIAGPTPVPLEAAFPTGLFLGWAHRRLETLLRRRRDRLGALVEERLGRGQEAGLGSLAAGEVGRQFALTLLVLAVAVGLRGPLLAALPRVPEAVRAGLNVALALSPWLAAAALAQALLAGAL